MCAACVRAPRGTHLQVAAGCLLQRKPGVSRARLLLNLPDCVASVSQSERLLKEEPHVSHDMRPEAKAVDRAGPRGRQARCAPFPSTRQVEAQSSRQRSRDCCRTGDSRSRCETEEQMGLHRMRSRTQEWLLSLDPNSASTCKNQETCFVSARKRQPARRFSIRVVLGRKA